MWLFADAPICGVCGHELTFAGVDEENDKVYWTCPNEDDKEHVQARWHGKVDQPIVWQLYKVGWNGDLFYKGKRVVGIARNSQLGYVLDFDDKTFEFVADDVVLDRS